MPNSRWVLVSAPGLPSWPRLWLDPKRKVAKVVVRHATWRSYQLAIFATEAFALMAIPMLLVIVWHLVREQTPNTRVVVFLIVLILGIPIQSQIIRLGLRIPLARQVFASSTVLVVASNAITFKSRLYENTIVIWRQWKGLPVRARFIIQRDPNALNFLSDQFNRKRNAPRSHLDEAMMIEVVIATGAKNVGRSFSSSVSQRTIPIAEVNGRIARKVTMVFTAACLLTEKSKDPLTSSLPKGVDIDHER